jgi:uncharacterized membrane protein YbhN (UPF0104 family)
MPLSMRSRGFRLILTLGALGFVAWSAWTLRGRFPQQPLAIERGTAALGMMAAIPAALLVGVAWSLLIRGMADRPPPLSLVLSVYSTASLGKYVPGRVGQVVMRLAGLGSFGYSLRLITASMIIELLSWIATGACTAALLLWFGSGQLRAVLGAYAPAVAAACLMGVVALAVVNRTAYPRFVRRALCAEGSGPLLPRSMPLLHLASWSLLALHGILLARSVGATDLETAPHAAAVFVLAPIAGFLALPIPAGVGVRESFTMLGVAPIVGVSNALALALLSRAASLIADVLLWLALSGKSPRRSAGSASDVSPG